MLTTPNPLIWYKVKEKTGKRNFRKVHSPVNPTLVPVSIDCHSATSCLIFAPVPSRWVFPPPGR
jgi:hypothetical protein